MSRFARRKDTSHAAVVQAFRLHGCDVLVVESAKADAWDLEVGFLGLDHPVEVKPLREQVSRLDQTKLRPSQAAFFAKWRGAPVQVVHSPEEVAALVKLWRDEHEVRLRAAAALARAYSVAREAS